MLSVCIKTIILLLILISVYLEHSFGCQLK